MFKKNKKQTETLKEPKEKKVRTVKVGTHKKTVIALWVVLIASVSFGVYKNFTAIDQHTTHEKEIIELRLQDTNGIENFVKNFAKSYYTWNNSKEAIEARTQAISGYLTKELQDLNVDTIRTDIPTSSTVADVIVWSIEQSGTDTFSATYEVDQQIKEGEQTNNVKATYTVKVHVDADGDMVIIQNPTLAPAIEKSDYEPKTPEADTSVDADTVNDATQHLPLSQAKAGDLVFFHSTYNAGSYVTHVGILVSPTQMYHAGNPIGYADLSSSYWQQHLIGAGRVKQ